MIQPIFVVCLFLSPVWVAAQSADPQSPAPANAPPANARPAKEEPKGRIAGKVTNEITGEPIKKAEVTAYLNDLQKNQSYVAVTDAAGKYAIEELPAGGYSVSVQRNGFVTTSFGAQGSSTRNGTHLTLAPGGEMAADVRMTPHSVVTGRIVDEDGDPMAHVEVSLMKYSWSSGKHQLAPQGSGTTNDLGQYRIFGVAPGKYYISASYSAHRYQWQMANDKQADFDYATTYYPNSVDLSNASRIDVPKGGTTDGVDFKLQKMKSYRITGKVVSSVPGHSHAGNTAVLCHLVTHAASYGMGGDKFTQTDSDGKFGITGLQPGDYELTANVFGSSDAMGAKEQVTISDASLKGITLALVPAGSISGAIRIEGDATGFKFSALGLQLEREQRTYIFYGPMPRGEVADDGSFTIKNVSSDRMRVEVHGLPDGYYVKAAHVGPTDVLNGTADFSALTGASIEVVLCPKVASIEGNVKDDKGDPVTNGFAVLIPSNTLDRGKEWLYDARSLDQNGHFHLKNLSPGSFKLFAFANIEYGVWMDPDIQRNIEQQGIDVKVSEGDKVTQDLKPTAAPEL